MTDEPGPDAAESAERPAGRRTGRVLLVLLGVVLVLVAVVVVVDIIARGVAEDRVAASIEAELPEGVEGEVDVRIGGFSVIGQYLSGRMDEVELSAPELTVQGSPVSVEVVAHGVPVDTTQPVGRVTATLQIDQESLNALVDDPAVGELELGAGTVGYSGSTEFLGLTVDYSATAEPQAAGDRVLLTPVDVSVGALGGAIDVSGVVTRLLGEEPLAICAAEHLPEGVRVEHIEVVPGAATFRLGAERFVLDEASLATKGSCD